MERANRYKVTAKTLKDEIEHSLLMAEKTGKHTDKLGYMLISLTGKIMMKFKIELPSHEFDDLQLDLICACIEKINKHGMEMNNHFNYLFEVIKNELYAKLKKDKKRREMFISVSKEIEISKEEVENNYLIYEQ